VRHGKADFRGKKVGVVLSGGNVDLARLAEYVSNDGRR
jgi:threonine dehydratase